MLIARSPVRLSLAGGGTDLPAYYEQFGGCVLSTTINKHFYVFVEQLDSGCVQISSSDFQTFYRRDGGTAPLEDGELVLPRTVLADFGVERGVSLFLASEIPPGTGLGSSSSTTVGLIRAMATVLDIPMSRSEIAERACRIEIDQLGAPIGKQDQYATAFGGLNWIEFTAGSVQVERVTLPGDTLRRLESNLMLFYTGRTRSASKILEETSQESKSRSSTVLAALRNVHQMAYRVRDALLDGDLTAFGMLLHETWQQKKNYAKSVSTPEIDEAYDLARAAGALGGKIAGAGGGGFLMIYAEPEQHEAITTALAARQIRRMDYRFECAGAQVLMNTGVSLVAGHELAGGGLAAMRELRGRQLAELVTTS
jgi:D-glycero-alpha-D-manno-heptose-7-phosphate kinase